jgi:hypothetical protein
MTHPDEPKRLIARDEEIEDDGALSIGEGDVDECPEGGEHDIQELRAATNRTPLFVFCVKCRQDFARGAQ